MNERKKNNNAVRLFCIVVLDVVVSVNAARFYFCQDAYNLKVTVILHSGLLPQSHWFFLSTQNRLKNHHPQQNVFSTFVHSQQGIWTARFSVVFNKRIFWVRIEKKTVYKS